jgi:hypothetical protein
MAYLIWTEKSPEAVEGQLTERKAGRPPYGFLVEHLGGICRTTAPTSPGLRQVIFFRLFRYDLILKVSTFWEKQPTSRNLIRGTKLVWKNCC